MAQIQVSKIKILKQKTLSKIKILKNLKEKKKKKKNNKILKCLNKIKKIKLNKRKLMFFKKIYIKIKYYIQC